MDLKKFKIWQSGMTDEEREIMSKHESVEAEFKKEKAEVIQTVNTKGFNLILDKVVDDIEVTKVKLLRCSKKDLDKLQLEIRIGQGFLNKWTPYMN